MLSKRIIRLAILFTTIFVVNACSTPPVYYQTGNNVLDAKKYIEKINDGQTKKIEQPVSPVLVKKDSYINTDPINLTEQPTWLDNRITIRGDKLPFSFYSRSIVRGSHNILTHYQEGLDFSKALTLDYSGTVKGALDVLASKTNYVYQVKGNNVYWKSLITKTFEIAFMPGSSDYLLGQKETAIKTTDTSGSNGDGGSSSSDNTISIGSGQDEYNNLSAEKLSIWQDIYDTLNSMKSADGKVIVSEAATTVTVRDHPDVVYNISKYIEQINADLSKQVMIKVEVVDIRLAHDFSKGIQWDVISKFFHNTNFSLTGKYGTPISISQLSGVGGEASLAGIGLSRITGSDTGVTLLIQALEQQGYVSVVTKPKVVTMNGQVASIRILTQKGYLASIENTTTGGDTANQVTSQITPGNEITGLTLYLLPKIMKNKVYLQISADLSSDLGITKISSGTTGSSDATISQIEVPNVASKNFTQRSVVKSGETLILSGYKRVSNTANDIKMFGSEALGGRGSVQDNAETVVLITPIILDGRT